MVREIGVLVFGALVYFGVRIIVEGDTPTAVANGERILRLEHWLRIDVERDVQDVVLDHAGLRLLGNLSYVWLHWPLLIVVLALLFRRDIAVYDRLRRALFVAGTAGLVLFWLIPTAPPRFMPGFEGTVSDEARRHYISYPLSWANRYAAMPSFHVGWTLIACLALASTLPTVRARALSVVPAVLVALAVVTTGNHYVADAVVGTVIAVTAYILVGRAPVTPNRTDAMTRTNGASNRVSGRTRSAARRVPERASGGATAAER